MSEAFLEHLRDLFSDFGEIEARPMFGGHGVYHAGAIIGVVIDDALYLKTDAQTRPAFEAAGCAPFVYAMQGREIAMSYWSLPDEAMDSPQAMRIWAQRAYEAALRKPKARRRRRRA